MENTILALKDKPKEFFDELRDIWLSEDNQLNQTLPDLIISLNKNHQIDFCALGLEAINQGFSCFDIPQILDSAFQNMTLNINSVIELIKCLNERMQRDLYSYIQISPFKGLAIQQPAFAKALIVELLTHNQPYIIGYVAHLYDELFQQDPEIIYNELYTHIDSEDLYVLISTIATLGKINYSVPENAHFLSKTLQALETLQQKNNPEIDPILIHTYTSLLAFSPTITKQKIVEYSYQQNTKIQSSIADTLFRTQDHQYTEDWFSTALLNLATVQIECASILDTLDGILYNLTTKDFPLFEKFIITWLISSNYNDHNKQLADIFDSTLSALVSQPQNLKIFITNLLNHDNHAAHRGAADMASYCQIRHIKHIELDNKILKNLQDKDYLFICRKILGYINYHPYLCSLLFSLLCSCSKNPNVILFVYSSFIDHVVDDHPHKTKDFFKTIIKKSKKQIILDFSNKLVKDITLYLSSKDNLPTLKELRPSPRNSYAINRANNIKIQKYLEEAENKSILRQIATVIHIKDGTGSFCWIDNKYSDLSKMVQHSTSTEIPYSEIIDPIGTAMNRIGFRIAKRVEI